jgi:indole-3-acetate monooxygenase
MRWLIELAGGKQPRGRPVGLLCDSPQVQDAVGRADAPRCRVASSYTADSAREAMDLVYHHGGSTSFKRESHLAECWRDLHTVGQTVTLAPEWYPIGGRVYLGLDPGPRLR